MVVESFYLVIFAGLFILVGILAFMSFFFWIRENRVGGMSASNSPSDLTNMMILFQTMRDILAQQKDLAREFNISIDRKVNEVRKLIEQSGGMRGDLDAARREVAALAARTRQEMAVLEQRLKDVDGHTGGADVDAEGGDVPFPDTETSTDSVAVPKIVVKETVEGTPVELPDTPLEILPTEVPGLKDTQDSDFIDRWSGVDLGDQEEDVSDETGYGEDEEDIAIDNGLTGEDLRDAEDMRDAFRDLLNLQPARHEHASVPTSSQVIDSGREGNGGQYLTPIQKRVHEYSDAGMRVPEIARELGVGKGEVRLILSLRRDYDE